MYFIYYLDVNNDEKFCKKLTFGVFVAECRGSHVTEAQGALAAAVHKQVAVVRVELCCCYHLCQILHVGWFDVHDV